MRATLLAAAFWIFVTVLYAAQIVWLSRQPGENINLPQVLTWNTTYYLTWIPLTLVVWRVARDWVPGAMRTLPLVARHLALATVLIVLHAVSNVLIVGGFFYSQYLRWDLMVSQVRGRLVSGMLVYVAIAGAGMAAHYYARWRERELASAQLEAQLSEAKLQALTAQLHPHFLFNSLHAIASLVRTGDSEAAVKTIASLSDLLRRVLDADAKPEITLAEEAAFIDRYFEIQGVRFGDRLTASIVLEPGTESCLVPALVLQPLVENAFRHGLTDRVGAGHVTVRSARQPDGRLRLAVEDNGAGLSAGWTLRANAGVGLRMTAARLEQRYGAACSFAVEPGPDGGTVAVMVLPA